MGKLLLSDDVDFDVFLSPDDVREKYRFPPSRFDSRDHRLAQLDRLHRGDFSDWLTLPKDTIQTNLMNSYATQVANLLLMSPPSGDVPVQPMFTALVDQIAFGGCVLVAMDGTVTTVDPLDFYPDSDGGLWAVCPQLSDRADSPEPDMIEIIHISDGQGERAVFGWRNPELGTMMVDWENLGPAEWVTVPKAPQIGRLWGTSKYVSIAAQAVEIANRVTRNSRVLDLNGRPLLVVTQADADAEQIYNLGDSTESEDGRKKLEKALTERNAEEVMFWGDSTQSIRFESPNVEGVRVALEQIQTLKEEIQFTTGLPDLSGDYQAPSGESLKRELLPFYAETLAMLNAMVEGLAAVGINTEWPHIFDTIEGEETARPMSDTTAEQPAPDETLE